MYESPIEMIIGNITSRMIEDYEKNILYQVNQAVGYSVDKNELLKALQYDRDQYQKGYIDALADIKAGIEKELNRDIGGNDEKFISGLKCAYGECLELIDKHISGKERKNDI